MSNANIDSIPPKTSPTRRQFIKIGAATLAVSIVSAGVYKTLSRQKEGPPQFRASKNKPNKNPAFVMLKNPNGTAVCLAQLPEGFLKHELNAEAMAIYSACDGKTSVHKIIDMADKKYRLSETEVKSFLSELENLHLIVTDADKVNLYFRTVVRYEKT